VAVSLLYHGARSGHPDALIVGSVTRRHLLFSAMERWLNAVEKFGRFSSSHPMRCLEVRYEDLSAEPHAVIEATFDFLGVAATTRIVDQVVACASFETWSGRSRGQEDVQSFFRKGDVGDWKAALDPEEIADINAVCGRMMRQKKYQAV
jgi:hypothetical protein